MDFIMEDLKYIKPTDKISKGGISVSKKVIVISYTINGIHKRKIICFNKKRTDEQTRLLGDEYLKAIRDLRDKYLLYTLDNKKKKQYKKYIEKSKRA